jgi:hypothetical protein
MLVVCFHGQIVTRVLSCNNTIHVLANNLIRTFPTERRIVVYGAIARAREIFVLKYYQYLPVSTLRTINQSKRYMTL